MDIYPQKSLFDLTPTGIFAKWNNFSVLLGIGETGPILDTGPSWTVALKIVKLVLRPWFSDMLF